MIKFGKIEADQLFKSYSTLRNKNELSSEELKLLHLVKAEINFLNHNNSSIYKLYKFAFFCK